MGACKTLSTTSEKVSTPVALTGKKSSAHTGLGTILQGEEMRQPPAAFIMKTIREAFYINDSINHLLNHFDYYNTSDGTDKKKDTNWDESEDRTIEYNPDVYVNPSHQNKVPAHDRDDPIGMEALLASYDELAGHPDNIRYCTFACIRQDRAFKDDSIKTLNFAAQVNSCPDDTRPAALGGVAMAAREDLGGGAKTRRNRSQGKVRTQRRRRRIVKPKSHPITVVTTQRRNMRDKKKGHRTRKMK
jgi:hypothetical protein